jgi:hypothetical protein
MKWVALLPAVVALAAAAPTFAAETPVKVLIIDGQNNHDWKSTTPFMKASLDRTGSFRTAVSTAPESGAPASQWDAWRPKFREFDCILLNYNGEKWPGPVERDFVEFVRGGGGVVVIHAANNAFGGWKEYEQMVGLLWRYYTNGTSLYVDDDGKVVREGPGQGRPMGHGDWAGWYAWTMTVRDSDHPITRGMPAHWKRQAKDELYHGQRGPAEDVHVLLTAYSDPAAPHNGTGKNEPIVWWVPFGSGRVITNVMGHDVNAMKCAGFESILARSCEWAATGRCSTTLPADLPAAETTRSER